MSWSLVPLACVPPQPWRNGGGVTRELLAWPTASDWKVRLSVADVQAAGPFSRFEGVERWFAVLEGAGVVLCIDGAQQRVPAGGAPVRFDGATPVHCELVEGATRDFNLMGAPGRCRLQRVRQELAWRADAGTLVALYSHAQAARVAGHGGAVDVPAGHLAWRVLQHAGVGTVTAVDALWMEAMP